MKLKPNYFIIPLTTVLVALFGSLLTSSGMQWYDNQLIRPDITPPDWAFPIAWNTIFVLATISALLFWNKAKNRTLIASLFIINAVLNVGWSLLFFNLHLIFSALVEMIVLEVTLAVLMILLWKVSRWASVLLLPYFCWVGFATYLTWLIWQLNI